MSTTLKQKKKDDIPLEVKIAAMNARIEKKFKEAVESVSRPLEDNIVKEKIPARLDYNNQTPKPKEKIPARLDDNQTLNPNPNPNPNPFNVKNTASW